MLLKPNLVDPHIIKKITEKHLKGGDLMSKFTSGLGQKLIDMFDTYKGLIIIIILLFVFLLFLHKFNKNISKKDPDAIEVNYIREVDIEDDKIVNITDTIEDKESIPDNILDLVKSKINDYDPIDVKPVDLNSLSNI